MSRQEAARVARSLTVLQHHLLHRAAEAARAGLTFDTLEDRLAEHDGGGKVIVSLRDRGLIRNYGYRVEPTPDGLAVAAMLKPLALRVRRDAKLLQVMQNARFAGAEWLEADHLTNAVRAGRGRNARYGLVKTLWTIGYLEADAHFRRFRLTPAGAAFCRRHLFDRDELDALAWYGSLALQARKHGDPVPFIPRPASTATRVARSESFNLSRPRMIKKSVVTALVRRGLLEASPGGEDAFRATTLTLTLVTPRLTTSDRQTPRPASSERPPSAWDQLTPARREALLIGQTDVTEFDREDLDALVALGLMRRYACGQWGHLDSYQRTAKGDEVIEAVRA